MNTAVEAKYVYAAADTRTTYQTTAEDVVEVLTTIGPSLNSERVVKITPGQSAALVKSLTAFGNACANVSASSAANTPLPPVIHRRVINLWTPLGPLTPITFIFIPAPPYYIPPPVDW